jgi:hypothetical protein
MVESMADTPDNDTETVQLTIRVPGGVKACLDWLTETGRYGGTCADVTRYLVLREVDDLTRAGILPKPLFKTNG